MDPRKILGVGADATPAEIQKAYRRQAHKHHPDQGGDAWAFQQVQAAYDQLTGAAKFDPGEKSKPASAEATDRQSNRSTSTRETQHSADSQPNKSQRKRSTNRQKQSSAPNIASPGGLPWKNLFSSNLPLQTETTIFILLNCLDVYMTYWLLVHGAIESNPIADFFMKNWGFNGMVAFKLIIVAVVCVIAQIVALKKIQLARLLLIAGSIAVGFVVAYSLLLYRNNFA